MSKRPSTYKEWRSLYQSSLMSFGFCTFAREGLRQMHAPGVVLARSARSYWRQYRRLQRIKRRLDAEHEAMDDSWVDAVLEMLEATEEDE